MAKQHKTLTEALRYELNRSDVSWRELERESGVIRQTLRKFAAGESSLRLDKADQLAAYFGIQIGGSK